MLKLFYRLTALCTLLLVTACDKKEQSTQSVLENLNVTAPAAPKYVFATDEIMKLWNQRAESCYQSVGLAMLELRAQNNEFLEFPSQSLLLQLQGTWNSAHQLFSACLIYQQPIPFSFETTFLTTLNQIESWPIQGGYIDYLQGYEHTGLINDLTVDINLPVLKEQHKLTDSFDVSLGFHALEFILWGDTLERSSDDFEASEPDFSNIGYETNAKNRRRAYLLAVVSQIDDQVAQLQSRWDSADNSFSSTLSTMTDQQQNAYILSSITSYITHLNSRFFNPEYENDLFLINESPYSHTTRDGVVVSFHEFETLLNGILNIQIAFLPEDDMEQKQQTVLMQDLLKELSFQIDLLPDLSPESLDDWNDNANKASILAHQFLDHVHDISNNLRLKLSYKK